MEILGKKQFGRDRYEWQTRAKEIIEKLSVPANKEKAIYGICKRINKSKLETALNDCLELAKGEKYLYFLAIFGRIRERKTEQKKPIIPEKEEIKPYRAINSERMENVTGRKSDTVRFVNGKYEYI